MSLEHRWFDPAGVRELVGAGESVYPQDLPQLLDEARAVAARHREPEVRAIR
jgi:hypothetical protein